MKKATLLLALSTFAMFANAGEINVDMAMQKGREFLQNSDSWYATGRNISLRQQPLSLEYTANGSEGIGFYAFNREGGGFVLVSAYDGTEEILAYSETGHFDYESASPELKFWLGTYVEQIDYARANGLEFNSVTSTENRRDILPLVMARWGQDWPFNLLCPKDTKDERSITGCVATAMAQVMKYYEWPERGRGYVDYTDEMGCGKQIINDLSKHVYDWSNMKYTYSYYQDRYSTDKTNAVAQLMYDCGTSVNMMYGSEASSAMSEDIPCALLDYFDYDSCSYLLYKDQHSSSEWSDILYSELENGRPVLYSGVDSEAGGHQFLCDGYNKSKNMFHFNFGWEGTDDDYYKLTAIGSGYKFNTYQSMVVGIQKPAGAAPVPALAMYMEGDLVGEYQEWKDGRTTYIGMKWDSGMYEWEGDEYNNLILSFSCCDLSLQMGLKFTNTTTGEVFYTTSSSKDNILDFQHYYGFYFFYVWGVAKPALTDGVYHITPVCRLERYRNSKSTDYWQDIRVYNGYTGYYEMTVGDPSATPTIKSDDDTDQQWTIDGRTGIGLDGMYIKNGKKYWSRGE